MPRMAPAAADRPSSKEFDVTLVGRECFSELHDLARRGQLRSLKRKLIDAATGRIRQPYRCDLNHAWYLYGDVLFRQRRWQPAIRAFRNSHARDASDWH